MGRHVMRCVWMGLLVAGCSADSKDDDSNARAGSTAAAGSSAGTGAGGTGAAGTGTAGTGGSGAGGTGAVDAGGPRPDCSPGTYVGTYKCDLVMQAMPTVDGGVAATDAGVRDAGMGAVLFPLEGPVSFDLQVDERTESQPCGDDEEFCTDLVIAEGSGTLFGFASFFGFETQLEGGLDCRTGEFRAKAKDGVWGFPALKDPADAMSGFTVAKPPSGMVQGALEGMHKGGSPQTIEGTWDLMEDAFDIRCPGPFTVELQP